MLTELLNPQVVRDVFRDFNHFLQILMANAFMKISTAHIIPRRLFITGAVALSLIFHINSDISVERLKTNHRGARYSECFVLSLFYLFETA